jgi:hypothetical protein
MLLHQYLSLLLDFGGLNRFAALYAHGGLYSLGDLPVQIRADLHRALPLDFRLNGDQ